MTSIDDSGRLSIPEIDPDADVLTAALAYAEAGWYVVPTSPRDPKNPGSVVRGGWHTQSSRDPEQIAAWFAGCESGTGIALHCGRSGAVVVDVDNADNMPDVLAEAVRNAPFQSTRETDAARGHYVFTMPTGRVLGNSTGKLGGAWGEIRGANGVIAVQPTPHPDGGRYRWVRTGSVPELPAAVAELLPDASSAVDAASDATVKAFLAEHVSSETPELIEAWADVFRRKADAGESRHAAMNSILAGAMKEAAAGLFPARAAVDALLHAFVDAVTRDGIGRQGKARTKGQAVNEFRGILAWAVGQADAADPAETMRRAEKYAPSDELRGRSTTIEAPQPPSITLEECHDVYRKWLGEKYDTAAITLCLIVAAVERLDGDPLWALIVSGSGNAKTETVQPLSAIGAHVVSTIKSEGALLSASPKRDRSRASTGGLLRSIGERGVLVVKDVTTILSASRDQRAEVLAALREIYDGFWSRNVGTDGGQTLEWSGRIALVGAVTTAWDRAHTVISAMGDRFVLLRMDSHTSDLRKAAGQKAIGNTGSETVMRAELANAVSGVMAGLDTSAPVELSDEDVDKLLAAADLVTRARTAVDYDPQGNVIDAHEPEMPTRFAKQLTQIVRGGCALGMKYDDAFALAMRCARDSMPPLRLDALKTIAEKPNSTVSELRVLMNKPRTTVDRVFQALHQLGLVTQIEGGGIDNLWRYVLADDVDMDDLLCTGTAKSGDAEPVPDDDEPPVAPF